jgi:hypothetical protein
MSDDGADDNGGNDKGKRPPRAMASRRLQDGEVATIERGLIQALFSGRIQLETVLALMAAVDEQIRQGCRPHMFVDIAECDDYDTDARTTFTTWLKAQRKQVTGVWVLYGSSSPMVKMGLWLAHVFTDGAIDGSDDPDEFDRAIEDAVRRAREGKYCS